MGINDNYDRNKLLKMVSDIFGEKKTKKELDECATLWELADNTTDSKLLSELSVSKYLEVRDAVIRRKIKHKFRLCEEFKATVNLEFS